MLITNNQPLTRALIASLRRRIANYAEMPSDDWRNLVMLDLRLQLLIERGRLYRLARHVEADRLEWDVIAELECI